MMAKPRGHPEETANFRGQAMSFWEYEVNGSGQLHI